jgi:hypothetical protein
MRRMLDLYEPPAVSMPVPRQDEAWRYRARSHREQRADLLRRSTEIEKTADVVMRRRLRAPVH